MVSFKMKAQFAIQRLKMFLEVESLGEIKKKLHKYYMVIIRCALHLDFDHIRDQLLTSHEILPWTTPSSSNSSKQGCSRIYGTFAFCKRMGHTKENYFLHGFLNKITNVSKAETAPNSLMKNINSI